MSDNFEEMRLFESGKSYSNTDILENSRLLEPSLPVCKVAITPSSPTSNKIFSIEESYQGTAGTSQTSSRSKLLDPLLTPIDSTGGNSKFLYVKEKFRRPSFLSDIGCRTSKESKTNQRSGNFKKDLNHYAFAEQVLPSVPPNTPSPSGWQAPSALEMFESKSDDHPTDSSFFGSDISSQGTTKALHSESKNKAKIKMSDETLLQTDRTRPLLPSDWYFESNHTLNWPEYLNSLKASHSGCTGMKSVGSASLIKSLWNSKNQKNIQHHCFMSDITDVRQMEHALLQLLEDFHSGKLRAFAKDCSMEQMQGIREQQERLARLHFDLGAQHDLFAPLSEEGLHANQENMQKLMGSLEQLSLSIEKLQLFSKDINE